MDPNSYGLIEITLVFGIVIGLALWELRSVNRAKQPKPETERRPDGERR